MLNSGLRQIDSTGDIDRQAVNSTGHGNAHGLVGSNVGRAGHGNNKSVGVTGERGIKRSLDGGLNLSLIVDAGSSDGHVLQGIRNSGVHGRSAELVGHVRSSGGSCGSAAGVGDLEGVPKLLSLVRDRVGQSGTYVIR